MRRHSIRTTAITAAALALGLTLVGCAPAAETTSQSSDSESPSGSNTDDTTHENDDSTKSGDSGSTERGADVATTEFAISWEDAVKKAMGNFDGELSDVELDWKRGGYTYSIELLSDSEEYDVHISADTGDVTHESTESLDDDDRAERADEILDIDAVVSWTDALATALDAQQGTVTEWSLSGSDDDGPAYQFDIEDDSNEDYEITIDAMTGEVIEIDN